MLEQVVLSHVLYLCVGNSAVTFIPCTSDSSEPPASPKEPKAYAVAFCQLSRAKAKSCLTPSNLVPGKGICENCTNLLAAPQQ